jgi:hypothetical protein
MKVIHILSPVPLPPPPRVPKSLDKEVSTAGLWTTTSAKLQGAAWAQDVRSLTGSGSVVTGVSTLLLTHGDLNVGTLMFYWPFLLSDLFSNCRFRLCYP